MARQVTQRELRNQSGEIMRGLDRGESFIITRNGVVVGELSPLKRRRFVSRVALVGAFADAPKINRLRLRKDLDAVIDQDPRPRG